MLEFKILRELLAANYERSSGNIFVVGWSNFPAPGVNAAYDFVPVGRQARCASRHGDYSVKLVVSILCRLDNIVAETSGAKRNASVGIDTRRGLAWGGFHRHGDR